jgi:O-antigen/teichoic acid export membrane protein
VQLALNIYLIVGLRMGVTGFVLSKLATSLVFASVLGFLMVREVGWRWQKEPTLRMIRFGSPQIVGGLAFLAIHFADRFFLSSMRSLTEVGVYSLAYKFAFLVTYMIGEPFGRVWSVTVYAGTRAAEWRRQYARVATYLLFFLSLGAVVIIALGGRVIVLVSDSSFWSAAALVPILVVAYVFREAGDFFRQLIHINKRVYASTAIVVGCAILNLALNGAWIGRYGGRGAAWATFCTWLAYMGACWIIAYREHRIPYTIRSFAVIAVALAAVCVLQQLVGQLPSVMHWPAAAGLVVLFLGLVWGAGYFPLDERRLVHRYVWDFRSRVAGLARVR